MDILNIKPQTFCGLLEIKKKGYRVKAKNWGIVTVSMITIAKKSL